MTNPDSRSSVHPETVTVVEVGNEVELYTQGQSPTLFGTADPDAVIEKATAIATVLERTVRRAGLISRIGVRDYPQIEAWTLLGTMLGVYPVTAWSRELIDDDGHTVGWEARVEAHTRSGEVIGAAEAECRTSERNWANRDSYALRSMAQTRAASKALRQPLGFVMSLAGIEATPAEEMTREPAQPAEPEAAPWRKAQYARMGATIRRLTSLQVELGLVPTDWAQWCREYSNVESRSELDWAGMEALNDALEHVEARLTTDLKVKREAEEP